jgi:FkbM family methyltransferase
MLPTAATLFEKLPRTLRRHRLMTGWMGLTGESPIQLVRIRDDIFAYADMSDGFLRLIVIDGEFDEDFFIVADALLSEGGVFLDVGANFGLLSFGLAGRHGRKIEFHLFEPNLTLVETIRRSLARFPDMHCTLNPVAVSEKPGRVSFTINAKQTGASHISVAGESGVGVPTITLDDYVAENGILRIDLLKLDVEGYELSTLRGAEDALRAGIIQTIYFEYFEKLLIRVCEPGELIAFLDSVDFVTCFCRPCDYNPRGGPTHTFAQGVCGHGLKLLPVEGFTRPPMTDLLAVPRDHLAPLDRFLS